MTDPSEGNWWRRTGRRAAAITAGLAAVSLAPVFLAPGFDGYTVIDLPLGYFLFVLVAPLLIALAIFVFDRWQHALDRRYDVAEE